MLYLVNCEVSKTLYMGNTKKMEVNHIVEAESEEEVQAKLESHYAKKDVEYDVSYWVNVNYINEVIS